MFSARESMGGPTSFSARRPNASNLPQFELPSPHLVNFQKYNTQGYQTHPDSGAHVNSLTSVGNLLTPPTGSSVDGLSPTNHKGPPGGMLNGSLSSHSYASNSYSWPGNINANNGAYTYSNNASPSSFGSSRDSYNMPNSGPGKRSNSIVDNDPLQTASYGNSGPYSAPANTNSIMPAPLTLPTLQMLHSGPMSAPVTQSMSLADSLSRHPQSPGYHHASQPSSATTYSYPQYPSSMQNSINTDGSASRLSGFSTNPQMPSLFQSHVTTPPAYGQTRPFFHSMSAPLSQNASSPSSHMSLGAGLSAGFSSSYAAGGLGQVQHRFGQSAHQAIMERPFRCDQCPQSFNRNHDLKRHKRIHLAVKPFPCGHCDKSFSRKDALKRHILVKGCGKGARNQSDSDRATSDGSVSPISTLHVGGDAASPVMPHSA